MNYKFKEFILLKKTNWQPFWIFDAWC